MSRTKHYVSRTKDQTKHSGDRAVIGVRMHGLGLEGVDSAVSACTDMDQPGCVLAISLAQMPVSLLHLLALTLYIPYNLRPPAA